MALDGACRFSSGDWSTFLQTWILRDRLQLVQVVHARLLELPEVVKLVGAINRYASAKFEEFSGFGNDGARTSFQRDWEACIFESPLTESGCGHLDGRFFFRQRAKDGGCAGPEFDKALDLQKFSGLLPNDAPQRNKKAMIYIPTTYNYAADAILAAVSGDLSEDWEEVPERIVTPGEKEYCAPCLRAQICLLDDIQSYGGRASEGGKGPKEYAYGGEEIGRRWSNWEEMDAGKRVKDGGEEYAVDLVETFFSSFDLA
ncbi:hypothetical protein BGX38DRAFT_1280341 [Terfezia claveryi]|nr:hypothetical protein BGX38DRAFT_1280341 [Terfezia claveryi]